MSVACQATLVHLLSNGNRRPILSVAPAFCNKDAELAILRGSRSPLTRSVFFFLTPENFSALHKHNVFLKMKLYRADRISHKLNRKLTLTNSYVSP